MNFVPDGKVAPSGMLLAYKGEIMNFFGLIWKDRGARIWFLVTALTLALALTVTVLMTALPFLRGTLNLLWGGERAVIAGSKGMFKLDEGLETATDVLTAADAFNEQIAEEGIVLLKNEGALPLGEQEKKVTVFGKNSVDLVYGGTGSGDAAKKDSKTVYDSLEAAGFACNPTMRSFYEGGGSGGGRPKNNLMGRVVYGLATGENLNGYDSVRQSYAAYGDAAVVVISRVGGEGFDLPRTMRQNYKEDSGAVAGARSAADHYLQLDRGECDMLKEACANFGKVVLVLNTAQPVELGFLLPGSEYCALKGYDIDGAKIQAALWVGLPGTTGIMALGRVLGGQVSPSGRTTDTYAMDFRNDPSVKNFGNNGVLDGNRYLVGDTKQDAYYVDYEEGIYVGYRYYETRGQTDGETWYKENVVFPFGYGLSYTDFDWEVTPSVPAGQTVLPTDELTFTVKVTNKGNMAGREVVQLYYAPPYDPKSLATAIEKPAVVLGDFAKTGPIAPHSSAEVTLTLKVADMRSYDYNDANDNGFKGYELEAGDYNVLISKNAHDAVGSFGYRVAEDARFASDGATGVAVVNRFDDVSDGIGSYLSRADWTGTFPAAPTAAERTVSAEFIGSLIWKKDDAGKPWAAAETPVFDAAADISMYDVIGAAYDSGDWQKLIGRLTADDMAALIGSGAYQTAKIDKINKPKTIELDGPSGWSDFMGGAGLGDTCFYAAQCVLGATWNRELALRLGRMIGNEALVAASDGTPISGWYAPGANIHRSPFAGRNWEYYGEDGYLSGVMAAQTCRGAREKGVHAYIKHFVLNDNETDRDNTGSDAGDKQGLGGLLVWANEQAMREIYFKPFEIAVKTGGASGVMSGFNRIGREWVGGNYRLLTEVLREEWGFVGVVVTDYGVKNYINEDQMIRAGGDLRLHQNDKPAADDDPTQVACLARATKNILYNVAHSNIMDVDISGYRLPVWMIALICCDAALIAVLAVWGAFAVRRARKKEKSL